MKITIVTQYYPPETGAPQNRLHSLARRIQAAGHEVRVLTAMPNYPRMQVMDGYRGKWLVRETVEGIPVWRSWIFVTKKTSVFWRLLNYFSFTFSSAVVGLSMPRSDFVICESPPLFLGVSAWLIATLKRARFVFNVSDLWPETAEKLGIIRNRGFLRLAYGLERWLYRRAFLVTGQTQGIVTDIQHRFPDVSTFWLPNGVDEEVYAATAEHGDGWQPPPELAGKKIFVYAGILGHAQGLEVIIEAARRLRARTDVAFLIIGDGPCKDALHARNVAEAAGVHFLAGLPKAQALAIVRAAYACIVPLKRLDLFKGAIPSKVFDPLALGVPILLGVEGEAKTHFIDCAQAGYFFEPENSAALAQAVTLLTEQPEARDRMGRSGRAYVLEHFNRKTIAADFLARLHNHA